MSRGGSSDPLILRGLPQGMRPRDVLREYRLAERDGS
jgi:hypothetical protein